MMDKQKIRVVLICHFSNQEVRNHLPLNNGKVYSFARRLLRLPAKKNVYGDIAPWDTDIINSFRKREDLDLFVISAHGGLKKMHVEFICNNVKYHFINCEIASMLKHMIKNPKVWLKFNYIKFYTRSIVNTIKPDIVMLAGAENSYISSAILTLKEYPVFVLCQTVYNNPERTLYGEVDAHNSYVEKEIIKMNPYFGVYCEKHKLLLESLSSNLTIFDFGWPTEGKLLEPIKCEKKYDFVNFALGMSYKKGYHDSIIALSKVKKRYPNVTLNLVGGSTKTITDELKQLAIEYNVADNVIFTDFFSKQEDMFRHIQQSCFALLPCKMDNVSGTMIQAMQLGLPIVVYKTEGTSLFNEERECALIAEHGNIDDLADKMTLLMGNDKLADLLRINARHYQEQKAEYSKGNADRMVECIKKIIQMHSSNQQQ